MKNYLLYSALILQFSALAQPGSLDNTFGSAGKITTDMGGSDMGNALVIQSDGKIIVAGNSNTDSAGTGESVFALTRYNSDGSLDNSFHFDGKVTTDFGTVSASGKAMCLQSDGKIVVIGYSFNGTDNDLALARYNSNGTLDNSFDGDGMIITNFGGSDEGLSVAMQTDGKIVVAGVSYDPTDLDFSVYRYNSNGSLDMTFDSDGKVTTDIGGYFDVAYAMAIQPDGKIVLAGYSYSGFDNNIALVRYNSNGSLDNSFDTDGIVTTDYGGSDDLAKSMIIQSDGKIVVAGICDLGLNIDFALARYNSNGTLDNTFDSDGKVCTDFGSHVDAGYAVTLQSDGKIIVAGTSIDSTSSYNFALARYNANGSLDNSFDSDGKLITLFGMNEDYGCSIAIQTDSKIVVAGMSYNSSYYDFAVARYHYTITGTETESNELSLAVYPNPSSGIFTLSVKNLSSDAKICIYDVLGNCLWNNDNKKVSVNEIDLSHQPKGIYFIEITYDEKRVVKKIVLQ